MAKSLHIPKIFFGFLAASFFMWMLINLSKKYTTKVVYNVEFIDLPQDKIFQEEPINQLLLTVEGSGFKLLGTKFTSKKITLPLDKLIQKNKTDFYLLTSTQQEILQDKLASGLGLIKIDKDSIHFKLGTLATKKVPVQLDLNLDFKLGYGVEHIALDQDSILLSGPKMLLDKIHVIKTKNLTLEDVSEDLELDLQIELPNENSEVKLNYEKVKAKVFIDKFTEGSYEIPITITGVPKHLKLSTFPKKVKVIYKVGLKNYQKITPDLFEVVCDYKDAIENELTYLIPEIKKKPKLISSVRIAPQRVDFLIQK